MGPGRGEKGKQEAGPWEPDKEAKCYPESNREPHKGDMIKSII